MAHDAIVVGGGPNGLAAAIVLARAGVPALLLEAADSVGGGTRTHELTLPGFRHDVCSAIHPMALVSPFLKTLPLDLAWVESPYAVAHPLDDGTAAVLEQSLAPTPPSCGASKPTRRAPSSAAARRTPSSRQTGPAPRRSASPWPCRRTPSDGRARAAAPSPSPAPWPAISSPSAARS